MPNLDENEIEHDTGRRVIEQRRTDLLRITRGADGERQVDNLGRAGYGNQSFAPNAETGEEDDGRLSGNVRGGQMTVVDSPDGEELRRIGGDGDETVERYIEPTLPEGANVDGGGLVGDPDNPLIVADGQVHEIELPDDGTEARQNTAQLSADDVPEAADDVIAWVGDDADRARLAREVENGRTESRRRTSVVEHISRTLGD